jgi:YD repeat-containing protein
MSKDYTFHDDLEATIGYPTTKSSYDDLVENTLDLDQRLEALMYAGMFHPLAGTEAYAYDGSGRVSTITYATSPVGVVTVVYDDGNGGRVNYVEGVFTDPVAATIRLTYAYDGSNNVTGLTRTVS